MDQRVEWRVWGPRHRRFQLAALVAILLALLWTFTFDDVPGLLRVSSLLVAAVSVVNVAGAAARTVADVHGIETSGGIRTRRVPWSAVLEIRAVRSEWADPKVEVRLTDGSTRTLPCVGTDDVPLLEELRTLARG